MAQSNDYFTVEDRDDVRIVHFHPLKQMFFENFDATQSLIELIQSTNVTRKKVMLLDIPPGVLTPEAVDRLWEAAARELPVRGGRREAPRRPLVTQVNEAIEQLLPLLRRSNTFVIASFQGEIDFDVFGTLLACGYRVCSEDTVFVNRVLDRGVAPGSGLFWLLSRYIGFGAAQEILVEGKSLTAREARELRLVNRVVPVDALKDETAQVVDGFAAKPASALASLMQASRHLDKDLETYLKHIGTGFDRFAT